MTDMIISIYAFGVGAIIGSFLNVLIFRLPRNEEFVTTRSHCPQCHSLIHWYDNIPLLSYIILRGKCRSCKAGISIRYPLVELITAIFFVVSYKIWGLTYQTAIFDIFFAMLLVVTVIDFNYYIIPDKITIPGMVMGLAFSLLNPEITPIESLIGLLAGGLSLYLLAIAGDYIFKKESLGGGDIKLAAMLGAFLGWKSIIIIFFGGSLLGLIFAVIQLRRSEKMKENRLIPFGPFLSIAALIALFFGDQLINLYLQKVLYIQ